MPRRASESDHRPPGTIARRLTWVTDPHFDHAKLSVWRQWADEILADSPDGIVVTGDLSEGDDVLYQLRCMVESLDRDIYFVLGNHDFYGGQIAGVRRRVVDLCREEPQLHYLTDSPGIPLSSNSVLIGDDGWGDATCGDYENSPVRLNDFALIEDFRSIDTSEWKARLVMEGKQSADRIAAKLANLPDAIQHILVATHVPPFRESCWYEGHTTDDQWAPFFVCGQVGEVLRHYAAANPSRHLTVLCGHTHHDGDAMLADNLVVHTGFSRYGTLEIESLILVCEDGIEVPRIPIASS